MTLPLRQNIRIHMESALKLGQNLHIYTLIKQNKHLTSVERWVSSEMETMCSVASALTSMLVMSVHNVFNRCFARLV